MVDIAKDHRGAVQSVGLNYASGDEKTRHTVFGNLDPDVFDRLYGVLGEGEIHGSSTLLMFVVAAN
jgi:hypothetical protein